MALPESDVEVDAHYLVPTKSHTKSNRLSFRETSSRAQALFSNDQSLENPESAFDSEKLESAIAPADHGRAAWLFLAGCFLVEGLVWSEYTTFSS